MSRIAFVCRGYPGLGKVMGAYAVDTMLRERLGSNTTSLFFSYFQGFQYLRSRSRPVVDLLAHCPPFEPGRFCAPLGPETELLVEELERFQPDLVVNDGEPYLIDVTAELMGIPTVVLAHPLDLHNPMNSCIGINSFRYFYSKAALVIAHGMERLPSDRLELGGRAGRVLEVNTIVRPALLKFAARPRSNNTGAATLACVLGGGTRNASRDFFESTVKLGEWTIRACNDLKIDTLSVFCADQVVHDRLASIASPRSRVILEAEPMDIAEVLSQADLVVGRSGRNLMSELVTLGKRGLAVPCQGPKHRASGQMKAALEAVGLNANLRLAELADGYQAFRDQLAQTRDAAYRPCVWQPGNLPAAEAIAALMEARAHAGVP